MLVDDARDRSLRSIYELMHVVIRFGKSWPDRMTK